MTTEYFHMFLQKSQKLGLLHDVLCPCQRTTSVPSSNPPISLFSPVPAISRRETKGMSFSPFKLCYTNKSQMSESWPSHGQPINLQALLHGRPSCSQPGQCCQNHMSRGSDSSKQCFPLYQDSKRATCLFQ